MATRSALINVMVKAANKAARGLKRDFGELENLQVSRKGPADFVSAADLKAEKTLKEELSHARPGYGFLMEESGGQAPSDNSGRRWLVDPLDGTTNYLHGFPQFSISIAVQHRGELVAAVVHDPLRDETFSAHRGGGAYLNEHRIRVSKRKDLHGALLGTGIPYRDQRFVDNYFGMMKALIRDAAGVRRPGSAALDFAWLAAGRIDGFWELGLAPWDFAAGALLVKEAGGVVTDLSGGERHFETGNLVAGNVKIHPVMLKTIQPFLSEELQA